MRAVDAFVDELDLAELGFGRATPADTGRPGYHPATLLKLYLYGYLNRVPSSRRLEREAQRNLEVPWLTSRLAPDFKTIAARSLPAKPVETGEVRQSPGSSADLQRACSPRRAGHERHLALGHDADPRPLLDRSGL